MKDQILDSGVLSSQTLSRMKEAFTEYLENILGLQSLLGGGATLSGVMDLLVDIRKQARSKKDFAISDKIRNELSKLGIEMKDEKNGTMSWRMS
jgi:cysteinyl-tRNA synthetase